MKKKKNFWILKVTEEFGMDPVPQPDPLVRDTDPRIRIRIRIRIRTKMSRIRNTAEKPPAQNSPLQLEHANRLLDEDRLTNSDPERGVQLPT
jgi:hypothetical protein